MVRPIADVRTDATGATWYVLRCGHEVIALDYKPAKGRKDAAWCPTCWLTECHQPTGLTREVT